jgi:hypothetical protein
VQRGGSRGCAASLPSLPSLEPELFFSASAAMLSCCSSKPRKRRARNAQAARVGRSRPGMEAEQPPPPIPEPVVPTSSSVGSLDVVVPPPISLYTPPKETLTPAVVTDDVEVRFADEATQVAATCTTDTWTATQPVALHEYEADRADTLGKGSFGVVVRGVEVQSGTRVAVKLLPMPTQTHEDYDSVRREAVVGGALQHHNIARIFASVYREDDTSPLETLADDAISCDSGTLYLVQASSATLQPLASFAASRCRPNYLIDTATRNDICLMCSQELADGPDMFWLWWESRPLTENRARFFATQLLDAMAYLQSVGICHRDLKLQNLLLGADRTTLKLSDFGTAVVVRSSVVTLLHSHHSDCEAHLCHCAGRNDEGSGRWHSLHVGT